jgi:hypothetical protein
MKKEETPVRDKGYDVIEDAIDSSKKAPSKLPEDPCRKSPAKDTEEEGIQDKRKVAARAAYLSRFYLA